jgi:ribosomal protein S30
VCKGGKVRHQEPYINADCHVACRSCGQRRAKGVRVLGYGLRLRNRQSKLNQKRLGAMAEQEMGSEETGDET